MSTLKKSALLGLVVFGLVVGSFIWVSVDNLDSLSGSNSLQIASEGNYNGGG